MRTTIDLPEKLVTEAMKITKAKTKTELIKNALSEIIQKQKIQSLENFRGKIDLDIDLDILRDRK